MNYQEILIEIFQEIKGGKNFGQVASYIPELAKVDSEKFGIHLTSIDNREFGVGDWRTKFSIQSIAKVFALSLAYRLAGDQLWKRVDVEPSGTSFNSLVQLESNHGIPRNPFMNAGAMVVCDILITQIRSSGGAFFIFYQGIDLRSWHQLFHSDCHIGKGCGLSEYCTMQLS